MKRKCSQRVICAREVRLADNTPTGVWVCEAITQDARRRLRPITGIVGHRTPRATGAVRDLAKAEGASLIIWARMK